MLNCILYFNLTIAVNISIKLLGYTFNLSQYLQKSNLDLAIPLKLIETITLTFRKMRENFSDEIGDI